MEGQDHGECIPGLAGSEESPATKKMSHLSLHFCVGKQSVFRQDEGCSAIGQDWQEGREGTDEGRAAEKSFGGEMLLSYFFLFFYLSSKAKNEEEDKDDERT